METWQRENTLMPGTRREGWERGQQASPVSSSIKWDHAYSQRLIQRTLAKLLAQCSKFCPTSHCPAIRYLPPPAIWPSVPQINIHWAEAQSSHWYVCVSLVLAENSAKSELFSIICYVKVFFSIIKYLFSTFCSFVREKAKARGNYVTCPGSSRSLQTEELGV